MHSYTPQEFILPDLKGISHRQVEAHLGLYRGYVKHVNTLREIIAELAKHDSEQHAYAVETMRRRLGFEFNGMRMHELYFKQWEGGGGAEPREGILGKALSEKYGDWDSFIKHFKTVGMSRGIGWTTLAWDTSAQQPHIFWTADHEMGMLADVKILMTMDMWEHAYMVDYLPAEKAQHVSAFLGNLNWNVVEKRFADATQ